MIYTASQYEHAVIGMMSKNNIILPNTGQDLFWIVQKSKNKVMFLPKTNIDAGNKQQFIDFFSSVLNYGYPKLSLGYLNEEMLEVLRDVYKDITEKKLPNSKIMKLTAVQSIFENAQELFGAECLAGKQYIDLRETRNKFQNKINDATITLDTNPSVDMYQTSIKPLIEPFLKAWDESEGTKYGWQRHSGYDKSFFSAERYEKNVKELQTTFLIDTKTNVLIGYSVISLKPLTNSKTYPYVIRKCNNSYSRNTTRFLDYVSFKALYETIQTSFSIHWGASSGGVLKYKLSAFPVTKTEPSYFVTLPSL